MIITRCNRFFTLCLVFSLAACCVAAQERALRVGIKPVEPFVINVNNDGYTGISIDLWEKIARINNIDFKEEYGIAVGMPNDPRQRNALVDQINASLIQVKSSGLYDKILDRYLGN